MKKYFYTVYTFSVINTKRFFRDRLAMFFTIAFPLVFLLVMGGIFTGGSDASFDVVLVKQSDAPIAQEFLTDVKASGMVKIDHRVKTLEVAKKEIQQGSLSAAIVIPKNFGKVGTRDYPEGEVVVYATQNNAQAGKTLSAMIQAELHNLNERYVSLEKPFVVTSKTVNTRSLTTFDYLFAGILGFSIIGLGIFGPTNVFPEMKKQGILRRFHTTPLRVSQFFISNAISRAIEGIFAMVLLFAVGILLFDITVVGNYLLLAFWILFSIFMILGIGLALGGWAKNQSQVAPLTNLITFPMIFLSGTFFPRFLMPEWLQTVSVYIPLTPVIEGIRKIVTQGATITMLIPELYLMAGWMIIVYYIAFRVFRWE